MYMTQFQHVLCIVLLEDLLLRYVITSWQSSLVALVPYSVNGQIQTVNAGSPTHIHHTVASEP